MDTGGDAMAGDSQFPTTQDLFGGSSSEYVLVRASPPDDHSCTALCLLARLSSGSDREGEDLTAPSPLSPLPPPAPPTGASAAEESAEPTHSSQTIQRLFGDSAELSSS